MSRPLLLDLFCCGGGAAIGYQAAGFDVIGVDSDASHRRRYPGRFMQADVLDLSMEFLRLFDAIHASPPCQFATDMNNDKSRHTNLIPDTRAMLEAAGKPYVIENVRNARSHLIDPVSLFGTMFDCHMVTGAGQKFVLSRERLFETNWKLQAPHDPGPQGHPIVNVIGGHLRSRSGEFRTGKGTGKTRDFIGENKPALAAQAMGLRGLTMQELSEAIPPVYTAWVGQQLSDVVRARRGATQCASNSAAPVDAEEEPNAAAIA